MQTTSSTSLSRPSRIASAAKRGGTKTIAVFAPVALHGVVDRVEDRDALDLLAGLARGDAGDDLGAVGLVAGGVEAALAAGDALHHQLGCSRRRGCSRRHPRQLDRPRAPPRASWPRRPRSSGARSARIARPSSSLVPSRRTTIGRSAPRRSSAVSRPSATSSQRVMPPKMLISSTFTFGSLSSTSSAVTTSSAFEPPPASRKFAGRPPAFATTSSVLITSPAPLPRMPTSPSSLT